MYDFNNIIGNMKKPSYQDNLRLVNPEILASIIQGQKPEYTFGDGKINTKNIVSNMARPQTDDQFKMQVYKDMLAKQGGNWSKMDTQGVDYQKLANQYYDDLKASGNAPLSQREQVDANINKYNALAEERANDPMNGKQFEVNDGTGFAGNGMYERRNGLDYYIGEAVKKAIQNNGSGVVGSGDDDTESSSQAEYNGSNIGRLNEYNQNMSGSGMGKLRQFEGQTPKTSGVMIGGEPAKGNLNLLAGTKYENYTLPELIFGKDKGLKEYGEALAFVPGIGFAGLNTASNANKVAEVSPSLGKTIANMAESGWGKIGNLVGGADEAVSAGQKLLQESPALAKEVEVLGGEAAKLEDIAGLLENGVINIQAISPELQAAIKQITGKTY